MTKILMIRLQSIINNNESNLTCFYDSLNEELIKSGNNVLHLNTIYQYKYENTKEKHAWIKTWINQIKEFNPDIIFTFNNQIFEEIINITNCPIVLWEGDLIDYFCNKQFIKKYNDRYYMATFCPKYIKQFIDLGFKKENILEFHFSTSVQAENKEKINNISFIGSNFTNINQTLFNELMTKYNVNNELYSLFLYFWKNNNYFYQDIIDKYLKNKKLNTFDCYALFDNRKLILQSILDLGLNLYGTGWERLPVDCIQLASAFNTTPKYTLKHNQDIYNSSIINLSISHPQCAGYSFPWRTYDIMASNGLLISDNSSMLNELTKGYVQIPMYKSPYEVRDLCKYALTNPNYCKDIIEASNKFIEKFGRWKDNFELIRNATNVNCLPNIYNDSNIINNYQIIYTNKYSKIKDNQNSKTFLHNLKLKQRFIIICCSIALIIGSIPIIDLIFCNKTIRNKIRNFINKYWR